MSGTPHNSAKLKDIAKTVLMPGDPLRAKFIAESYLENSVQFNQIRNMLGYTGTYNGKPVSVMGSGMGMPSMGIYSYELFHQYDVDNIIRIGTAGALSNQVKIRDIVIAMGACTNSNYGAQFEVPGVYAPIADYGLLRRAVEAAEGLKLTPVVGNICSTDIFYEERSDANRLWKAMGILAIDMETAALYMNAARAGKHAISILTISDHIFTGEALSAEDRQTGFKEMMEIALGLA